MRVISGAGQTGVATSPSAPPHPNIPLHLCIYSPTLRHQTSLGQSLLFICSSIESPSRLVSYLKSLPNWLTKTNSAFELQLLIYFFVAVLLLSFLIQINISLSITPALGNVWISVLGRVMSEEHDKDCAECVSQSDDDQCQSTSAELDKVTVLQDNSVPDTSANTSEEAQISAISCREVVKSELNENNDISEEKIDKCRTLVWTREGSKFTICWNLPDDTTTPKDFVALCYAG